MLKAILLCYEIGSLLHRLLPSPWVNLVAGLSKMGVVLTLLASRGCAAQRFREELVLFFGLRKERSEELVSCQLLTPKLESFDWSSRGRNFSNAPLRLSLG